MSIVTFKQGEDKIITAQVIKAGLPESLTLCPNIKAILKIGDLEIKKYSLIPEVGFGTLTVGITNTNEVSLVVERDHSKLFPVGRVDLVLLCSFSDSSFGDSIRVEEYKFAVAQIIKGEGTNEIIP